MVMRRYIAGPVAVCLFVVFTLLLAACSKSPERIHAGLQRDMEKKQVESMDWPAILKKYYDPTTTTLLKQEITKSLEGKKIRVDAVVWGFYKWGGATDYHRKNFLITGCKDGKNKFLIYRAILPVDSARKLARGHKVRVEGLISQASIYDGADLQEIVLYPAKLLGQ